MYTSIQFTKTTSSRKQKTNVRSRTLPLFTVITAFVALAIPFRLSAQTPLSAHTITTFEVPGSIGTQPSSINRTGTITGFYADADGLNHGFVRDNNGNITTVDVPGATNTSALSINSTGEIAGLYQDGGGYQRGVKGSVLDIDM